MMVAGCWAPRSQNRQKGFGGVGQYILMSVTKQEVTPFYVCCYIAAIWSKCDANTSPTSNAWGNRKWSDLINIIYTIKADTYFWKEPSCLGIYELSRHRPSCLCFTQNTFQHTGNEEIFPFMPVIFTQWKWLPLHQQNNGACHCA